MYLHGLMQPKLVDTDPQFPDQTLPQNVPSLPADHLAPTPGDLKDRIAGQAEFQMDDPKCWASIQVKV